MRAGSPIASLPDVDLVDGPLEDEVAHVGDRRELRARLVRGQGHDGLAGVDLRGSGWCPAAGARMIDSMLTVSD